MDKKRAELVRHANTGREVRGYIKEDRSREKILKGLIEKAGTSARTFAGPYPDITYYLFDFDGRLMAVSKDGGKEKKLKSHDEISWPSEVPEITEKEGKAETGQ